MKGAGHVLTAPMYIKKKKPAIQKIAKQKLLAAMGFRYGRVQTGKCFIARVHGECSDCQLPIQINPRNLLLFSVVETLSSVSM